MHDVQGISLTCLFCEDIRLEPNGRSSIVGWYAHDVFTAPADVFPLLLSRFAGVLILRVPADFAVTKLKLEMYVGDELRYTVKPEDINLQGLLSEAKKLPAAADVQMLRVLMQFPNLQVDRPGRVFFRAEVNDVQVNSNPLDVRALPVAN